ncbi:hypothetical protein HMPREF9144_2144 [Prevotella pallens ATCC 700821]|uniref:Uncharacterized protein n=1 Tax=Prevotella pallens ATCC 700821 TaxID=997353 RepID=F9DKF2_9BACT|nr:hypothetical protein HMPREF9144_2144 [Prevotella pallens ATCC 700821]
MIQDNFSVISHFFLRHFGSFPLPFYAFNFTISTFFFVILGCILVLNMAYIFVVYSLHFCYIYNVSFCFVGFCFTITFVFCFHYYAF